VAHVIGAGIVPAGLEMMDRLATRGRGFRPRGLRPGRGRDPARRVDGTREEVAHEIEKMIEVMRASGATSIRCSANEMSA
jgi:glycolate oxidase